MKENKSNKPTCTHCGATGSGAQFKIFSKYGFGTYCVPCETAIQEATR